MTADREQIRYHISRRLAGGASRQEIIFELERMGLSRAEANKEIGEVVDETTAQPLGRVDPRSMLREDIGSGGAGLPFYKRPLPFIGIAVAAIFLLYIASIALRPRERVPEHIAARNSAALTGAPSDGSPGMVSVYDIRTGDCFDDSLPEGSAAREEDLNRVKCGPDARLKVLGQGLFPGSTGPGSLDFYGFAGAIVDACPDETLFFLVPSDRMWEDGDRVVTCIGPVTTE
jgi:hypothetical protein